MKKNVLLLVIASVLLFPLSGVQAQDNGKAFDAHATTFSYFFKDSDMDFHFGNIIIGAVRDGGAEVGEAFYAASRITDGDDASWQAEWYALAQRVEARGLKSLTGGHLVSARDQLLRAAYYYRISLISMQGDNPEMEKRGKKCRSLMQQAGKLFDPPLEYFEVPFEGTVLPGFFRKADNSGKPAKTLLMIGGGETYIEDLFFYIAQQTHDRGYNFMTIDLPGQGMLPHTGHVFRTDTNVPMKVAVDYALSRPEVAPRTLAAYGISGGGLFVPQAAMHDPRIKAIAMSSGVVDAHALFATMPAAFASEKEIQGWTPFHAGVVQAICWRYGVDKPSQLVEANRGNTFDSSKIQVPALLLMGEGEYRSKEVQRQQKIALDGFLDPRSKMVITPSDEGATNHCLMENRSLVGAVLFDWLDEVLK